MKLFLSGVEKPKNLNLVIECGQKYLLMSYLYLRKNIGKLEDTIVKNNIKLMVDSGAYTILVKGSVEEATKQDVDSYFSDYLDFLNRYKSIIDLAVELDIQDLIGLSRVESYRKELFKIEDIEVCYVIHNSDIKEGGKERINYYFKSFPYIGISKEHTDMTTFSSIINLGKVYNKKVHGFGITGVEVKRLNFSSIDSTTWLGGARYGTTYVFTGQTLETWDYKNKYRRKRFKLFCEKNHIDFENFCNDKRDEVNKFNCLNWVKYAEFLYKRWNLKEIKVEDIKEEKDLEEELDKDIIREETIQYNDVKDVTPRVNLPVNELVENNSFLRCNFCYIKEKCPAFKIDSNCNFKIGIDKTSKETFKNIILDILGIQYGRVVRGKIIEEADGGFPDKALSNEISMLMDLLVKTKEMMEEKNSIKIEAKGKDASGSIIQKLFGDMMNKGDSETNKD